MNTLPDMQQQETLHDQNVLQALKTKTKQSNVQWHAWIEWKIKTVNLDIKFY